MPEHCTCGAKLVEDARFCHKCGRPLRDEPAHVEVEAPPPLSLPKAPAFPAIGFHNPIAVWIALRVALGAFALSMVTGYLLIFWFLAGGFVCVYLYRRRTGETISNRSGAHLGWLSGVFAFVLFTILFTIIEVQLTQPEVAAEFVEQVRKSFPESDAKQAVDMMRTPVGVTTILVSTFTLLTLLPALGGWLGARFLQGSRGSTDERNA